MNFEDFDYCLPEELIAQHPLEERDASRLLILHKDSGGITHATFRDIIRYLHAGDLMLLNDTKVVPARLLGKKATGGRVEVLLIEKVNEAEGMEEWRCMAGASKGMKNGAKLVFGQGEVEAAFLERETDGLFRFVFSGRDLKGKLERLGSVPLPPYIKRRAEGIDRTRYQTVFARTDGAVAAPTAGLHFTEEFLAEIKETGVEVRYITLHTGPATFMPVRVKDISKHKVPGEPFRIEPDVARSIIKAKKEKKRVVAVGSTVTRAIEAAFMRGFENPCLEGRTALTIYPGFTFKVIDVLVTNFHLPRSTLIMMVSAFAGRENIMRAYREAVALRYRFFSYGDCMMVV